MQRFSYLVRGTVSKKNYRITADGEGLEFTFTVKVTGVEAAEIDG